eukprot:TRINITY_DN811_c0_g1_i4.p1 TRINITY_DN811_c0_g1~~TRINITY_DN811_c0_g1_i4.p1  ORF type:complete len:668 (-),score=77.58 TRINITY_DN811_c0_g1_i4:73-1926(-)
MCIRDRVSTQSTWEPKKQSFWENQLDEKQIEEAYNTPKYISDYGEQFENIYEVGLFIYNLETKTLEQVLLPENLLPFYPQFFDHAGDQIIIAAALNEQNFKFGCYACCNRNCGVYLLDKDCLKETVFPTKKEEKEKEKKETPKPKLSDFKTISTDAIAIYPKVSPDLERVAYFSAPMQKAHQFIMELKIYEKKTQSTKSIIPIQEKIDEKQKFAGITGLQANFQWFENSKHALLNSHIDNEYHFYLLDITTNELKLISPTLENRKNMNSVLAINKFNNDIIFKSSNFQDMIKLQLITGLNLYQNSLDDCCKSMKIHSLQYQTGTSQLMSKLQTIISTSKETKLQLQNSQANAMLYSLNNYETDYLKDFKLQEKQENQIISDENKPLIVIIHGGPHSTSGAFTLMRLIFLLKGYNVLVPNYTGTLGYGQKFVDDLLGKVSVLEFNEIAELISQTIKLKLCHPEKIIPMGGSNGGYLTGLLAGKENPFNVKLRAGILMNPVLNLPYMAIATDIIDWIYSECFNKFFENYNFTPEDYAKMYEQSPMNYPSKIPLLLLLGKVDRRVPFHQGLAYTVQCQKNNQSIETFVYPKSNHALGDSVNTEYDVLLRCLNFIEKQLAE